MGVTSLDAEGGLYLPVNSIHMLFMRFDIDAVFVVGPGCRAVTVEWSPSALPCLRGAAS